MLVGWLNCNDNLNIQNSSMPKCFWVHGWKYEIQIQVEMLPFPASSISRMDFNLISSTSRSFYTLSSFSINLVLTLLKIKADTFSALIFFSHILSCAVRFISCWIISFHYFCYTSVCTINHIFCISSLFRKFLSSLIKNSLIFQRLFIMKYP